MLLCACGGESNQTAQRGLLAGAELARWVAAPPTILCVPCQGATPCTHTNTQRQAEVTFMCDHLSACVRACVHMHSRACVRAHHERAYLARAPPTLLHTHTHDGSGSWAGRTGQGSSWSCTGCAAAPQRTGSRRVAQKSKPSAHRQLQHLPYQKTLAKLLLLPVGPSCPPASPKACP